ncbi:tyrosine-type recombinase/integrase [Cyclobacterium sp. 1_MG-2023]|uniref:tyrosine-type recombinase/integrase n=1 Tax=Cyclobacterium sp. 1_MG-2023 TaxID=3062681 RepID=UPI0026E1CE8A|nr:tyrosine-type recombinase/integrase [Cyclobacterium sp. 1_MG-2023]MDO6436274.1 tyrosine-type recombinase/integrase [Cyclobacterium sp. 1_MG-2023]
MATIKYLIRSQANRHVPIYFYVSLGRGSFFRMKTGFNILPKNWSSVKGFPKPNDEENKRLMERLKSLESFLMEKVNEAQAKGINIDKSFFERQVDECFNRVKPTNKTMLSNHIKHIIETAPTRKIKGKNKIGLSENTVKNYNTFLKVVLNYEKHLGKPIHFLDIDFNFIEGFKNWLINDQKYSANSSGKSLAFIKSISIDAEKHGVSVNPFVNKIEAFSEANEDRYIITLTFGELDQIKNTNLKREALINARKWLLLGCEIGQRVEDLLKITEANLRKTSQGTFIDLQQNKTKKDVTIPVNDRAMEVLNEGFPYRIADQNFNDYIKKIAKEAKLNELVKGKKYDKSSKRKVLGNFPKHELITSHACRRSFATNYYKIIPTTILMGITGHTKESTFLVYINKPKDRDENARLFLDMMKRVG